MIQKSGEHIWSLLCHYPWENNDSGHISVVLVDEKHALKQLGGVTYSHSSRTLFVLAVEHPDVRLMTRFHRSTNCEILDTSRWLSHLGRKSDGLRFMFV